jgi:hypothetical protein
VEFGNPIIRGVLDMENIEGDYFLHFVMLVKVPRGTLSCVIFYFCGSLMVHIFTFDISLEKEENVAYIEAFV